MFSHDTRENRENQIKISDLSYQTVKELLNYMYTGSVTDLEANSLNLFVAADKVNYLIKSPIFRNSETLYL